MLIRLIDLEPQFRIWMPNTLGKTDSLTDAQGITFECPIEGHSHWILVWFAGKNVPTDAEPLDRWTAKGTSYHDLTLTPSVDVTCKEKYPDEWHGFVTNGRIT